MLIAALYAVSMAVLLVYGLNLLWMAAQSLRLRRPLPAAPSDGAVLPCVTVQLPLYNEQHVALRLLDACAALDYPRDQLEIQVLDDSTDGTVALVAARVARLRAAGLDIAHVRRPHRQGYKAGALQHGLQKAKGDFIALFDADFVPPPHFLREALAAFDAPDVGMVQARWGHLNAAYSLLTRIQAFGLDAHFALEQDVRARAGLFMSFNGTAGVWRRACIEGAGGWTADTLTEDLDLSYRAQLAGWRFRYLGSLEAPAELPVEMQGLRQQQFRWTKGAAETTRKLIGRLLRAPLPLGVKVQGVLHLTAHSVFPFLLLAGLLHPLLMARHAAGAGPGPAYFAALGVGLVGFAGFLLAHAVAQQRLYRDWARRMLLFPLFLAGSAGLALSNTVAIAQAAMGWQTAFVRTAKFRVEGGAARWWQSPYAARRLPFAAWAEAFLALYALAGLGVLVAMGAWAALPFQAVFALGFSLVTFWNVRQRFVRA